MVTITAIDVDAEMNRAFVYFDSLLGEDGDAQILEALHSHRVRIQGSIGRQVRAKKTPILTFKPDEVIRSAEHIQRILDASGTLPERPVVPDDAGLERWLGVSRRRSTAWRSSTSLPASPVTTSSA